MQHDGWPQGYANATGADTRNSKDESYTEIVHHHCGD